MTEVNDDYYLVRKNAAGWKDFFRECGRKGGKTKSAAKTRACRRNGCAPKRRKHK